jgi:MFS family permease
MPNELSMRIASFYFASALSGAFSGLLAAGIAQMKGLGGYAGWRWIFIIEGIVTVVLGIACFFMLIDTPRLSHKWLEPEEIRYLELQNLIKQGGKHNDEKPRGPNWKDVKGVLLDWKIYMMSYHLVCIAATSYGSSHPPSHSQPH